MAEVVSSGPRFLAATVSGGTGDVWKVSPFRSARSRQGHHGSDRQLERKSAVAMGIQDAWPAVYSAAVPAVALHGLTAYIVEPILRVGRVLRASGAMGAERRLTAYGHLWTLAALGLVIGLNLSRDFCGFCGIPVSIGDIVRLTLLALFAGLAVLFGQVALLIRIDHNVRDDRKKVDLVDTVGLAVFGLVLLGIYLEHTRT